jgi:hypothetical protein
MERVDPKGPVRTPGPSFHLLNDHQGGTAPGLGLRLSNRPPKAHGPTVQPTPVIATGIAPDNESVFVPLYEPLMVATPAGAKVTVHPTNAVDVKVAPAIGTLSFMAVTEGSCSFQWPFVALVVIVSVPPALSVHPPIVGGAILRVGPATVTVPLVEKLWQTTVIAVELMTPLNDIAVPGVRVAVTTVPMGSELDTAYPVVPVAKSNVAAPSAAASNFGSDLMKSVPPFG